MITRTISYSQQEFIKWFLQEHVSYKIHDQFWQESLKRIGEDQTLDLGYTLGFTYKEIMGEDTQNV